MVLHSKELRIYWKIFLFRILAYLISEKGCAVPTITNDRQREASGFKDSLYQGRKIWAQYPGLQLTVHSSASEYAWSAGDTEIPANSELESNQETTYFLSESTG